MCKCSEGCGPELQRAFNAEFAGSEVEHRDGYVLIQCRLQLKAATW